MRRLLVVSTATSMLMTSLACVALADRPVIMDRFVDEFAGPEEEVAEPCGLPRCTP